MFCLRKVWMFYEKSGFLMESPDFFTKSHDFLRKVTIFYEKSRFFTKCHDFLQIVTIIYEKSRFTCPVVPYAGICAMPSHIQQNAHTVAARGSTPPRFSPQAPLIPSHLTMAEGDAAETTTRWRRPEAPCHHRAQGTSVNPFGYPPLSEESA